MEDNKEQTTDIVNKLKDLKKEVETMSYYEEYDDTYQQEALADARDSLGDAIRYMNEVLISDGHDSI